MKLYYNPTHIDGTKLVEVPFDALRAELIATAADEGNIDAFVSWMPTEIFTYHEGHDEIQISMPNGAIYTLKNTD